MLEIKHVENDVYSVAGRFDASQIDAAKKVLDQIETSVVLDCQELEYISSAGLGLLLVTQKRLDENGCRIKLIHLKKQIRDVFQYSGFDTIFEVE
ncbi:STAS domain-containing protein [candidate division KSB1 bacterium]|nr:STAS domain-containing protein [candidate division KSB1 bacterium]